MNLQSSTLAARGTYLIRRTYTRGSWTLRTVIVGDATNGTGVSIAAPMTAICANHEAHSNPQGRYVAAVIQGLGFIAFGIGGATAISLIQAFPTALVTVVAGMALLPAILQALRLSVGQSKHTLGATFALLIGASEINILGINSAFWAIVGGVVVAWLLKQEPAAD